MRWNAGTETGGAFQRSQPAKSPPSAIAIAAAARPIGPRARVGVAEGCWRGVERPDSASRSKATSEADWNRRSGFFSRQWRTIRSRPGEMF
jgi:hypothetical protein